MLSLMRLPRRSTRPHWTEFGEHRVAIVSSAALIAISSACRPTRR
jgi:hypothetical protein